MILTPNVLQVLTWDRLSSKHLICIIPVFLIILCRDYYYPYQADEAQKVQSTYLRLHSREESETESKYKSDSLKKFIAVFLLLISKRTCFIKQRYQGNSVQKLTAMLRKKFQYKRAPRTQSKKEVLLNYQKDLSLAILKYGPIREYYTY